MGSEKDSNRGDARPDECVLKSPTYKQGKSHNKKETPRERACVITERTGWSRETFGTQEQMPD